MRGKGLILRSSPEDLHLLTAEEVARLLKVASVTAYQWARRGVLPHYHLEGAVRFKLEDIKAFVESHREEKK